MHGRLRCINVGEMLQKNFRGSDLPETWGSQYSSHERHQNYSHQIPGFSLKMHQIPFRLRLQPRPRCGSSQRSPRPPLFHLGKGKGERERGKKGKGEGDREGRRGRKRGGREREREGRVRGRGNLLHKAERIDAPEATTRSITATASAVTCRFVCS